MRNGKIFIIDTSFWNDDKLIPALPNFKKAKEEQGVDGVINRIGQGLKSDGSLYVDIDYVQNMILEQDAKLPRGSYYFLDHNQYNYTVGQAAAWGAKQAKAVHKFMITSGLIGEMPPAIDAEENVRWGRLTQDRIVKDVIPMASAYLETLSALFNNNELFYYCNRYFESLSKGMTKWNLWLAVLSGEGYDGNKDLDHFTIATIEQWGSYMDGRLFGFDNGAVDTNRWNKSADAFYSMMKRWNPNSPLWTTTPTPEDEIPIPGTLYPDKVVWPYSQKNPLWAFQFLGFSKTTTLAENGCLDAILASNARFHGIDTDPGRFNQAMKAVQGFEGALIIWDKIADAFPGLKMDWDNFLSGAEVTDAKVDAILADDRLVMVQVDYNQSTATLEPHWVLIIGKGLAGYRAVDPIDGSIIDFNERYKKMLRMAAIFGPSGPETPPPAEEPTAGRSKWIPMCKSLFSNVRIRTGPVASIWNMTGKYLPADKEIAILAEQNDTQGNKWIQVGIDQWAAEVFNGQTLITRKW